MASKRWDIEVASVDATGNAVFSGSVTASGGVVGDITGDVTGNVTGGVIFPSADPLIAGMWWDNAGTLTKSTGA